MTPSSEVPPLLLETLERAWLEEMIAGFTPAESKAVGLALTDTEAGTVVSLRVFPDVPLFNRTLNLGMYCPVTDAALDELLTVARDELLSLEELERRYVDWVLIHTDGDKVEAARILGINLSTLYRWKRRARMSRS